MTGMAFDSRRLRAGELIAGSAAILLFLDLFLTWYRPAAAAAEGSDAWTAFRVLDVVAVLVILATLGLVALAATQRAPALPLAASTAVTGLGALLTLLILARILDQPGPNAEVTVRFGAYLGLLLAAGIAAGGFIALRDEGTAQADARAQADELMSMPAQRVSVPPAGPGDRPA